MSIDIQLVDGDLPLVTQHISGNSVAIQRTGIALTTQLGEYFLDREGVEGLPLDEWRAAKIAPIDEVTNLVRERVERVPGVLRVDDVSGSVDLSNRAVVVFFSAVLPEEGSVRLFLDVFGNGQGITGVDGQTAPGVPFVGLVASTALKPTPAGQVGTILPVSGTISGAGGTGGSGAL